MAGKVECPLHIGQRVAVSHSVPFCGDWPGEYTVTAVRWEYNKGAGRQFNISIASDDEIQSRMGDTDGFSAADLIAVASNRLAAEPDEDGDHPDCVTDRECELYDALMGLASHATAYHDDYKQWTQGGVTLEPIVTRALRLSTTGKPKP